METGTAIDEAAAAWAAKVDRGEMSAEEQAALEQWASEDPRHAGAYARAMATNAYFDRAAALGTDFSPQALETEAASGPAMARRRFVFGIGAAAAASALGLVGYRQFSTRGALTTAKGDVRRIAMNDGSAITLNTDSQLEPHINERIRRIELVRGEAFFDVSKDPARPFIVIAGDVQIRVVGTQFSVRRFEDEAVEVAVLEGVVDVQGPAASQRLVMDQRLLLPRAKPIKLETLQPDKVERALGWRQGILDLNGMTLAQAAREFARYSDRRIRINDPAVGAMKVAGVYSTSDPMGFARAAALSLGIEVVPVDDGVLLRRP